MAKIPQLTETNLQYLALQNVGGADVKTMAESTGLSEWVVRRITLEDALEGRNKALYEKHTAQARLNLHAGQIRHQLEMENMKPMAYAALNHAVTNHAQDARLAKETAWEILRNAGVPLVSERGSLPDGTTVNTQINVVSPHQEAALKTVFEGIAAATSGMSPLPDINAPNPHRHVSTADTVTQEPVQAPAEGSPPEGATAPDGPDQREEFPRHIKE